MLSPISIRLSSEVATVECETCGAMQDIATADRDGLVLDVRAFLRLHGVCPLGG